MHRLGSAPLLVDPADLDFGAYAAIHDPRSRYAERLRAYAPATRLGFGLAATAK
jgi:hypothetical protein